MTDDAVPDEPDQRVQISTGRVWKVGDVRPGQAQMDWHPDANDDGFDDQ